MKHLILVIFLFFWTAIATPFSAQPAPSPGITVLSVNGQPTYRVPGWSRSQPLRAGANVPSNARFSAQARSSTIMCPDGRVIPAGAACPQSNNVRVRSRGGLAWLDVQRGGRESTSIPYLIFPRATFVRQQQIELVWNVPQTANHFTVTVLAGGSEVWSSERMEPEDIATEHIARVPLPITLEENTPYTVNICMRFDDTESGCTSDAAWSAPVGLAFFYVPDTDIQLLETAINTALDAETPEALYARAVLLSQPLDLSAEDPLAYYGEAIAMLEQILEEHSDSALAASPEFHNTLGELYRRVNLPISAARTFARALELAAPGTETSANAAIGSAMTAAANDSIAFYDRALSDFADYLPSNTFKTRFKELCGQLGNRCRMLTHCENPEADCETWSNT